MEKITYREMIDELVQFNIDNNITSKNGDKELFGVVVLSASNFKDEFSELERSYRVSNLNKAFIPKMISNSIYGNCLDGKDLNVRLDWYIPSEWDVDYCYIER